MLRYWSLLQAVYAPFDGVESLVLSSSLHHNIGKLLESCLDSSDALIDILQLRLNAKESCGSRNHEADRRQNVAVRDGPIE